MNVRIVVATHKPYRSLYAMHRTNQDADKDDYTEDSFLEEVVRSLKRTVLTQELYDYFYGLISALPGKLKRELLQKRMQQLMPKEPCRRGLDVASQTPAKKRETSTRKPIRSAETPDPAAHPNYYASYSVAGTSFIARETLKAIRSGMRVKLLREPDNKYDHNAIVIMDQEDRKMGYIPRKDNVGLAAALDGGQQYYGVVSVANIETAYPSVDIDIFEEV